MADSPVQRHNVVVAGLLVTFWTFLITFGLSVTLVFTTWILAGDRSSTLADAFKVVVWGFLAMQGVPLVINSVTLSLPFLGFIFITLISLYRSSRWAIRSALHEEMKRPTLISLLVVSIASISYGLVIALLRFLVSPENINWLEVMLKPSIMVISMSILAVGTVGGTWSLIFDDLDEPIKRIIRLIFRFSLIVLLTSMILILVAIGFNYENMLLMQSSLLGGVVAIIAVIISGIGWFPNFILWAWAFLTNSTIILGAGSSINLNSVTIAQLPAWPWFGLVPTTLPSYMKYFYFIPIFFGILIAISTKNKNPGIWIVSAMFVSLGTASAISLLSFLSTGSLGSNLLLNFGVSSKEVFQKSMIWFLIGEAFFIALILLWQSAKNRNKIEEDQVDPRFSQN
ncbi:MAG: DUF6350 family protein [Actinomycetes bacterium]